MHLVIFLASAACASHPDAHERGEPSSDIAESTPEPAIPGAVELRIDDEVVEIEAAYLTSEHARNEFYWLTIFPKGRSPLDTNAFVRIVTPGHDWPGRSIFWPYEQESRLTRLEDGGMWLNTIGDTYRSRRVAREEAHILSQLLKIPLTDIVEPTYRLEGELLVEEEPYRAGHPIWLTLRVTNVGDTEVSHWTGGWQRGANRHHRFDWVIRHGGEELPKRGRRESLGGLGFRKSLPPGESFDARVEVSKWANFSQPGDYELRASYHLKVAEPKPVFSISRHPFPARDVRWDQYEDEVVATKVVTVLR